jgi:hypothetical protein
MDIKNRLVWTVWHKAKFHANNLNLMTDIFFQLATLQRTTQTAAPAQTEQSESKRPVTRHFYKLTNNLFVYTMTLMYPE